MGKWKAITESLKNLSVSYGSSAQPLADSRAHTHTHTHTHIQTHLHVAPEYRSEDKRWKLQGSRFFFLFNIQQNIPMNLANNKIMGCFGSGKFPIVGGNQAET